MFSLSDIFTPSFFIILVIVVMLIAVLVIYIENKAREQNHKIASMLSLVSSLAEELNGMRFHLMTGGMDPNINVENNNNSSVFPNYSNGALIEVSDDEVEEDEEEEEEDDDEEDDDEDEEDEDEDDDLKTTIFKLDITDEDDDDINEEPEIIEIGSENDIKVLKINNSTQDPDLNYELSQDLEQDMNSVSDLETLESASEEKQFKNSIDLKSISFSLEENETKVDSQSKDIKKASLQTLRLMVIEKKIMSDPSKLKKHELLKLLGATE